MNLIRWKSAKKLPARFKIRKLSKVGINIAQRIALLAEVGLYLFISENPGRWDCPIVRCSKDEKYTHLWTKLLFFSNPLCNRKTVWKNRLFFDVMDIYFLIYWVRYSQNTNYQYYNQSLFCFRNQQLVQSGSKEKGLMESLVVP